MLAIWPAYKKDAMRNAKSKENKSFSSVSITRPTYVRYYNEGMGGTDGFDTSIARYRIYLSSKRWPHRVIFYFLNASIINTHILFKLKHKIDRYHKSCTKFGFMSILIFQMLKEDRVDISSTKTQNSHQPLLVSTSVKPRIGTLRRSETRLQGQHLPCVVPMPNTSEQFKGRLYCRWPGCNTRTRGFCLTCNIPLCLTLEHDTSCFIKFHTVDTVPNA